MNETQQMLDLLTASFPDITSLPPSEGRRLVDARVRAPANIDDVASTDDVLIEADDRSIAVRIYRPHEHDVDAAVTVFAHGGGFLHGSIASHDGFCRLWAKQTRSPVISVDYRLSPENGPLAGRDDMVAVVDWAHSTGLTAHGIVLAGDSSGGNVAASAGVVLRDRGASPVTGQVLIYPFLDPSMSSQSHHTRADGYFVTRALLAHYWRTHLGERFGERADDPTVAPLAVADLTGLPPTIVVTAGLDPLNDEGCEYARRLRVAGTTVLHRHFPDQFHGFLTIAGYGPARSATDILWNDIRALRRIDSKDCK
ncbi:alpha/beta hydrolase [Microbacterium abyssi]|uniref:alpha/beta hydrolase n=1 Tax=Microbacterium abyssi TaxID=2782166 RepID=UPI001887AE0B|nr:alpha/beta hydrolase [Microbacterium sp. A18JL241]